MGIDPDDHLLHVLLPPALVPIGRRGGQCSPTSRAVPSGATPRQRCPTTCRPKVSHTRTRMGSPRESLSRRTPRPSLARHRSCEKSLVAQNDAPCETTDQQHECGKAGGLCDRKGRVRTTPCLIPPWSCPSRPRRERRPSWVPSGKHGHVPAPRLEWRQAGYVSGARCPSGRRGRPTRTNGCDRHARAPRSLRETSTFASRTPAPTWTPEPAPRASWTSPTIAHGRG